MKICPRCGIPAQKVIYAGFPFYFCSDELCHCLWGFWSFIPVWFQFQSGRWIMMAYEGSYLKALWHWLKNEEEP